MIPEIHLSSKTSSTRSMTGRRAFPLNEPDMPNGNGTIAGIRKVLDWLDVEKSARYIRDARSTFCNIYAYDYGCRMGAYLPRVWWSKNALLNLDFSDPAYGSTLMEMNANALYDWFPKYGTGFGWTEANTTDAQIAANQGHCVIMVAANKNRAKSGHIVAIVPETDKVKCMQANGLIIYPVQSQAGAVNKKYFCSKWWHGHEKPRIYVHEK